MLWWTQMHAPSSAHLEPALEVGDCLLRIGRNHGHRVRRCNEELVPQDHVAVTIAVTGCTKVGGVAPPHDVHQLLCIGQVGVRVPPSKVLLGSAVPARQL